ncbi:Maf family protein [Parasedimentitalea psychrophila]|uniref:Nucleoside triphosphate pyrophosphatase n=1 Tax=Parasedimentitalea psychrophila TaxID=2997337 RepID=A0A9Y2L163_9RHOB|nr:nucleoside triphosphate pyrophosphatase [Parasedimentitalea psychrophila]WIY26816.1 nucleoside triphosphate pyrophosphatase [Parasedimentitalea psychrophila]
MSTHMLLASGSAIRAQLLRQAGIEFEVQYPEVDEQELKTALLGQRASPREISDALAALKAKNVSSKSAGSLVLGCDQVLDFEGSLLSKPESPNQALAQLTAMRGKWHMLLSAAVICRDGEVIWRHVGQVRLQMRHSSDAYLQAYVTRNWDSIRQAVGGYKLEEEGVRLFSAIDGDYFNVLGLPLMEIINFLALQGMIEQ